MVRRALCLGLMAVVLGGCSGMARHAAPASHAAVPPPVAKQQVAAPVLVVPVIPGRTPAAVMHRIVAQLGGGGLRDLHIGRAPHQRGFGAYRRGSWLSVRVPAGTSLTADYAQWVARMAVHTFRDQARRRGFRMMDGVTMDAPGAHPYLNPMNFPPPRRRYPAPNASAALEGVRRRAAMLGLHVARLRVLHTEGLIAPVITLQGTPSPGWLSRLARHGVDAACVPQDVIGAAPVPRRLPRGVSPGFAYPFLGSFTVLRDARGRWLEAQVFMANTGDETGNPHIRLPAPKRAPSVIPSMPVCPPLAKLAADIR